MNQRLTGNEMNWDMGEPAPALTPSEPTPNQAIEAKQRQLEATAIQKMAMFGSDQERRTVATAYLEENDLGQDQSLIDMRQMEPLEFAMTYGFEAAANRHRFNEALRDVEAGKNRTRTGSQRVGDTAIDIGVGAANTLGGIASLGGVAVDTVLGTNTAPAISDGMSTARNWVQDFQSPQMQNQREQFAIEQELDRQDRETRYRARQIENTGEGSWDEQIRPWLQKQAEGFGETVGNLWDNPAVGAGVVAEGIGSFGGMTVVVRGTARVLARQQLSRVGNSADEVTALLRTDEGRALINSMAVRVALPTITAAETGGAVSQAVGQIMSMTEEQLSESPSYRELREAGASHEEAQEELAGSIGLKAGLMAAPGAALVGRMTASFQANPLGRAGTGSSQALTAGRNLALETGEETFQEGQSQAVTNAAMRSEGFDVALDEGVAVAGAMGAVGGLGSSVVFQGPGVAVAAASAAGATLLAGGEAAVRARQESQARAEDNASPVGGNAQIQNGLDMAEISQRISQELPPEPEDQTGSQGETQGETPADGPQTPQDQTTEDQSTDPMLSLRQRMAQGNFLDEEDVEGYATKGSFVARYREQNPGAPVPRTHAIRDQAKTMTSKSSGELAQVGAALNILSNFAEMQKLDSTVTAEEVNQSPEGSSLRTNFAALQQKVQEVESWNVVQRAREMIQSVNPDALKEAFALDRLNDPATDAGTRKALVGLVRTVSQVNPEAIQLEDYDLVLNQSSGTEKAKLEAAKKTAESFRASEEAKARIGEEFPEFASKTRDIVRREVLVEGNSNNKLPSLMEHYRKITEAGEAGRVEDAREALTALENFASGLNSKVAAINASAEEGLQNKKPYRPFGPFGFFDAEISVQPKAPNSVALARDVAVDAGLASELARTLAEAYGIETGTDKKGLEVPALAQVLTTAPSAEVSPIPEEYDTTPQQTQEGPTEADQPKPEQTEESTTEDDGVVVENEDVDQAPVEAEPEVSEAKPEQEPVEGVAEPEKAAELGPIEAVVSWLKGLKDRLLNRDGFNVFLEAFRPNKTGSLLTGVEDPVAWLEQNLESLEKFTDDQKNAIAATMADTYPDFSKEFTQALETYITITRGKSFQSPEDWGKALTYDNLAALNFVVEGSEGGMEIEPKVMAAMFMSLYEWALANAGGRPRMDDDAINKMFGLPRGTPVSQDMRKAAIHGIGLQPSIEQIATKMEVLLGVQQNRDVTIRQTQGLFRGMAAQALEIWMDDHSKERGKVTNTVELEKVIEWINTPYKVITEDGVESREMKTLRIRQSVQEDVDFVVLKKLRDPFSRIFVPGREKERLIGASAKSVSETQIGNRFAKLSKLERQVIKRLQETPAYINVPLVSFMEALGGDVYKEILGYKRMTPAEREAAHPDYLISVEGKNQSLDHGLEQSLGYIDEVRFEAEQGGKDVGEITIHHKWEVSSVGRLQQQGPVTPQGDKTAREIIAATRSTVNLGKSGELQLLWLAVAQSIGVKVEKGNQTEAVAAAQELVESKLAAAVGLAREFNESGQIDAVAFRGAIKTSGIAATAKLIHAVLTVARIQDAQAAGGEAAARFKTALAFEADGKTDGPINAMIHMGIGAFNARQIERFAKGGFFFTGLPMSLGEFIKAENKSGEDLYHMAAELFRKRLREQLKDSNGAGLSTLQLLSAALPDFTLGMPDAEGIHEMKIDRGVTKNPLTVFLYGSGKKGVAGKIAAQVTARFNEVMQEIIESGQPGQEHSFFRDNPDVLNALGEALNMNQRNLRKWLGKPKEARITIEMMVRMQEQILVHFAEPMFDAVNEGTGSLQIHMEMTQKASQIQAAVFKDVFDKLIKAKEEELNKRQENAPEGSAKLLLSDDQISEIFQEAMEVAPIYETDAQSFHISGPSRTSQGDTKVASSFSGSNSVRATYLTPSDASVKVSPYMTIGTGDGRMIMNIYLDSDGALQTSLPVFDGIEVAVDQIMSASEQMNGAVFKGWMEGNPYQAIANGYRNMSSWLTPERFEALSEQTKKEVARAVGLKKNEVSMLRLDHVMAAQALLDKMAMESAARKMAMKRMASQTDHLAGASAPYGNKGLTTTSNNPLAYDEIVELLNEEYYRALAELKGEAIPERTTPKPSKSIDVTPERGSYAQEPSQTILNKVKKLGTVVAEGVTELTGEQIPRLLTRYGGASAQQLEILKKLLMKDPQFKRARYFFGTSKALTAMRDENFPDMTKTPIELGQTHLARNIVFIANASAETLLHEMLHTHTGRILSNHFKDPMKSPEHVQKAVQNLTEVRNQVMTLAPDTEALALLQHQMKELHQRPAAQLSELISYGLSNLDLIKAGKATKVSTLVGRVKKILEGFKRLLGIETIVGNTLFSNIRFSTQLLLSEGAERRATEKDAEIGDVLDQVYGTDARITWIEERYLSRLRADIGESAVQEQPVAQARIKKGLEVGRQAAEIAVSKGFRLNARQARAFEAVHATMSVGLKLNPDMKRRANEAYRHVVRTLTKDSFHEYWNSDQISPEQRRRAESMRDFVIGSGENSIRVNAENQTDLLATFVALSQVDGDLRGVLEQMKSPKVVEIQWDSVDNMINSLGTTVMNLLTRLSLSPKRPAPDVRRELDELGAGLTEIQGQRRFMAALAQVDEKRNVAEAWTSARMAKVSEATTDWLVNQGKDRTKIVRTAFNAASYVTSIGSDEAATKKGEGLTSVLNETAGFASVREALNDLRGQTESNAPLLRLINVVKARIDAMRQDFREGVPEELARHFSRKLKKEEWSALHMGMARTDLLTVGRVDAMEIIKDPAKAGQMIQDLEEQLGSLGGVDADRYKAKGRALAIWMVRKENTSENLLRNAEAIARLLNESRGTQKISPALVTAIDKLTTLYAWQELDQGTRDITRSLMETEAAGMEILTGFQNTTRALELQRRDREGINEVARLNGWKGYVPALVQEGASIIVKDDSKKAALERRGYVRVGDYVGDRAEGYRGKRGYYQSTVAGKGAFRQGVAQTVNETWQGVDARSGQTLPGEMAGLVLEAKAKSIAKATRDAAQAAPGSLDGVPAGERLIPLFDGKGNVVAYERSMDPMRLEALQRDTHLGRMLGVWAGRILEEEASNEFNQTLVKTLGEIYRDELQLTKGAEFVNVADPKLKDAVVKDAWDSLGWRIKSQIHEEFGEGEFWVRGDMLNDALGYRAASVTDFWSGVSRWSPENQMRIREAAELVMGKKAFEWLKTAENTVTDLVSYAKTTIIVRSVVVGWQNFGSNILHLSLRGVNMVKIVKGMKAKWGEITEYVKNQEEKQRLQVRLGAVAGDAAKEAPILAQIAAIEDANARLSIKPLLDAGEFSTISEGLTEADVAIRQGKWAEYIESAVKKLPGWAATGAKNLLVTKDTALFQALNRMVQYGDFVAKAVLYDHMQEEGKKSEEEILDVIREEFVQYNRLPGRGRDFLESVGLMWFWNYKIRIMKVLGNTVRERPLSALFMMGMGGPTLGMDTVWDGSLVGNVADGSIDFSIGPSMGINAPTLNPWWQLTR